MTNETAPGDEGPLADALADQLRARAATVSIPGEGRARVSARVEQRRRTARVRRASAVGAVFLVIAALLVVQATRGADDAQRVDTLAGTSTTASPTPPTTFTSASGTTAVVVIDTDTTSLDDPTTTALVPVTAPPTSGPPVTTPLDLAAPGVPYLTLTGAGQTYPGSEWNGTRAGFAGAQAAWVTEDWGIVVVQRYTDTFLSGVTPTETMRPIADGEFLLPLAEGGGWNILPIRHYLGSEDLARPGDDGGYLVSGTDATTALDLVEAVVTSDPVRPAALHAGSHELTLVEPSPGLHRTAEYSIDPNLDHSVSISITVSAVGPSGWRGDVVPSMFSGTPSNIEKAIIGGRTAWIADIGAGTAYARSVIVWEPNDDAVVVIDGSGMDAARLASIIQQRLQRIDEATWRAQQPKAPSP
jgi:hypothetical protein